MIPGVGGFSINIPQFDSIDIKLPENKILKIRKKGAENYYINSLKLRDKPHYSTWISWEKIKKGGILNYQISNEKNDKWFLNAPPSYN
jgi:putative alpha-1,2-mannosidase